MRRQGKGVAAGATMAVSRKKSRKWEDNLFEQQ